ncbi:hypothetical protein AAG906_011529 [Vitis piasezkii]
MIKLRFRSLKGRCTSLNEVFFIIRAEEGRSVMLDTPITEGSALVTMKPNSTLPNNNYGISEVSRLPINKNGIHVGNSMESHNHLVEGMEIDMHNLDNGMVKPILLNLKENSQPKISASNDSNVSILNREEIERLCSLLTSMDKPTTSWSLS